MNDEKNLCNHLMIDIETLSTSHDAAMLSIAAVPFNYQLGTMQASGLHLKIEMTDSPIYGHIDPRTVHWWMLQSKEAQEQMTSGYTVSLQSALLSLEKFCHDYAVQTVWSHGSSFDLVILRNAFQRHAIQTPWDYWQERDTRTLFDITHTLTGFDTKTVERQGTHHNAFEDAKHQARQVIDCWQSLKEGQSA